MATFISLWSFDITTRNEFRHFSVEVDEDKLFELFSHADHIEEVKENKEYIFTFQRAAEDVLDMMGPDFRDMCDIDALHLYPDWCIRQTMETVLPHQYSRVSK